MTTPKPETGGLTGEDGTMLLKGSAGRISLPTQSEYDPSDSRANYTGLDHFSGLDSYEE